ncbi:hypothetical protein [Mycoplasma elephantis]|uniref:hypothetical protein n=1 Tax=Mycoplasma elephantis TaxID=114882 RepID=UPI0004862506|nr:hypothetical protein [Mycoplasma elephantis]
MLTKKFTKVFWLSMLATIFMIVSILLFVPSVIYVGKSKQIQHFNFDNINFIILVAIQNIFILLLLKYLITNAIKDLKDKTWASNKDTKLKTIMFYFVSSIILLLVIASSVFISFGVVVFEGDLKPLGTITTVDGKEVHTIFSDEVVRNAMTVNDKIKYILFSFIFAYFLVIFILLITKISLVIKNTVTNKKQIKEAI